MSTYNQHSEHHSALETISTLAFVCVLLGILFKFEVLFYIALALLFIGIFIKGLSSKIAKFWLRFADLIGYINTRIILTAVFFFMLTPIAFVYRLLHGDFLNITNKETNRKSYWHSRTHLYQPKDFEKMW